MFGRKEKPEAPVVKKEPQSWDDKLPMASPQKSAYFNAMRSHAYGDRETGSDFVEFWVGMQVDREQDKWRIVHYTMFDLDKPDGKFKTAAVTADCSFSEAIYHMAKFDGLAAAMPNNSRVDNLEERFPADKHPEMKAHFYDVEHYKLVANIQHIAFNEAGHPYRTIEGKVFATSTFQRSEVAKSILAAENVQDNPKLSEKIEAGVLADIYNAASERNASLDDQLKVGKALAFTDAFASYMGTFYLGIQAALGKDDKFDRIRGLTPEERADIYGRARSIVPPGAGSGILTALVANVLPTAASCLAQAKGAGVHVEPFEKHLAECELYAHLLDASLNRRKFRDSLGSINGVNLDALTMVQSAVQKAQVKFTELGGSAEQFDRLQAWVANDKKDTVPPWVAGFLDRYYDARKKTMKKIQERQAGPVAVQTMSVKIKPPILE